jgi:hypothetical protein
MTFSSFLCGQSTTPVRCARDVATFERGLVDIWPVLLPSLAFLLAAPAFIVLIRATMMPVSRGAIVASIICLALSLACLGVTIGLGAHRLDVLLRIQRYKTMANAASSGIAPPPSSSMAYA